MSRKARVELSYDGWDVYVENRRYHWNHNDEDLGTEAIATMLKDLGYDVEVEEVC